MKNRKYDLQGSRIIYLSWTVIIGEPIIENASKIIQR